MIPAANAPREFFCPHWPGCQCPDDTVALDCPGRTLPAAAHERMASPAAVAGASAYAPAWFRDHFNAKYAEAKAEAEARRGRTISGETLIRDINAVLARCDKSILEISAIQTELAMIRNDMGQLHGLPVAPLARKAT